MSEAHGRRGVPGHMTEAIQQFSNHSDACVLLENGEYSDWFDVMQFLRQGCVLAPLHFDIFFATYSESFCSA